MQDKESELLQHLNLGIEDIPGMNLECKSGQRLLEEKVHRR